MHLVAVAMGRGEGRLEDTIWYDRNARGCRQPRPGAANPHVGRGSGAGDHAAGRAAVLLNLEPATAGTAGNTGGSRKSGTRKSGTGTEFGFPCGKLVRIPVPVPISGCLSPISPIWLRGPAPRTRARAPSASGRELLVELPGASTSAFQSPGRRRRAAPSGRAGCPGRHGEVGQVGHVADGRLLRPDLPSLAG